MSAYQDAIELAQKTAEAWTDYASEYSELWTDYASEWTAYANRVAAFWKATWSSDQTEELRDYAMLIAEEAKNLYQDQISSDQIKQILTDADLPSDDDILGLGNDQQDDGFTYLTDGDDALYGQSDIKLRMMGGNDYLEVIGGNNYANGNMGKDTIILRGGFGEYLGGKDSDTIKVFGAEAGSSVNGNLGEDFITGTVAGVTYRGGKDNDLLEISQGDVWGDKGADTFRTLAGDGFAVVQDYTSGEDMVDIEMDGSWSIVGDGLMFTDDKDDQRMLLLGINNVDQVTRV
jgi:hypothetical protein